MNDEQRKTLEDYLDNFALAGVPPGISDCLAIKAALTEIDRLCETVDQLPKTTDGIPITPNMTVWLHTRSGCREVELEMVSDSIQRMVEETGATGVYTDRCYSTREAAEKVMGDKK